MRFIVATAPGNRPEAARLQPRLSGSGAQGRGAQGAGGKVKAQGAGARGRGGKRPLEARPGVERAARGMGCGPSRAADDRTRVPEPRKGWEEGVKVKQTKPTRRHKAFCHARGAGAGRGDGRELGPRGPQPCRRAGRGARGGQLHRPNRSRGQDSAAAGLALRAFCGSRTFEGGPTPGHYRVEPCVPTAGGGDAQGRPGTCLLLRLPASGPFENYLEFEDAVEALHLAEPSCFPPEDPGAQRRGRPCPRLHSLFGGRAGARISLSKSLLPVLFPLSGNPSGDGEGNLFPGRGMERWGGPGRNEVRDSSYAHHHQCSVNGTGKAPVQLGEGSLKDSNTI